jgi:hypothetical protein
MAKSKELKTGRPYVDPELAEAIRRYGEEQKPVAWDFSTTCNVLLRRACKELELVTE